MKRGVSPYASGGGGVTLERRVAVIYLARMLTGTTGPELGGRRVTRVAFQQGPEHAVDDLVVSAAREDGSDQLELAIAVRRAPSFQASDQHTEKLIGSFVRDLLAGASGDGREIRLAVCVGGPQAAAKQVATLAAHARSRTTADGFFSLMRTPGCFERPVVDRLSQVVALVAANTSQSVAETVTWRLLTRLDVLMPRVEPPDETDWGGALIDQLMPWARAATTDAAISLRDRLESLAGTWAPAAADVDRAMLRRAAREAMRDQAPAAPRALPAGSPPYLEQVRQIAPAVLLDREAELAELAGFCAELSPDQSPYLWWRADAWSGKSALLSWFVLNPPPRTRVVAFFVTARWGAQNDRAAFTDAVAEQLAHLLGEQVPASLTDTTRYGTLLRLLRDAAQLCQDNGERLVLVVDGLDEDRGVDGPSGHSIAGLLPASPPAGCRVVVASRPNPPVPFDVPDNHPLRGEGILRPLTPSAHAGGLRSAMERELHLLLAGTPFERDLLGLLVAAGGGLGARELAELTGKTEYEVAWRLKTSAARSFSMRPARWQPESDAVYLLAHEELRVSAAKAFGSRGIAEYRDRVHRWADGYRFDQWPADTPEYLLDGYHRMLMADSDVDRAAEYASDRFRHERLRSITGGDSTALAEISASLDALRSRPNPDLRAMARLAMYRDTLGDRNRLTPWQLPGLWARLGQPSRAEAMARSLPGWQDRAMALTDVAETLAAAGHRDRALSAALDAVATVEAVFGGLPQGSLRRASLLIDLVRLLRELGAEREASAVLHTAETAVSLVADDESERARLMVQVAQILRDEGKSDGSLTVLSRAEDFARGSGVPWYDRGSALATIAVALEEAGEPQRALSVASDVADIFESFPDQWYVSLSEDLYVSAVCDGAMALDRVGRRDRALTMLHRAEEAVRALIGSGDFSDVRAVASLAGALGDLGDGDRAQALFDRAEAMAEEVAERQERMRALAELGQVLAERGDVERALGVVVRLKAFTVPDVAIDLGDATNWVDAALIAVTRGLKRSGDDRRAHSVLARAEAMARSVPGFPRLQVARLADIALTWEELGDRDRAAAVGTEAGDLAEAFSDLDRIARGLSEAGRALATAGARERAAAAARQVEAIAHAASTRDDSDTLLGLAARVFTAIGDHGRAEVVAGSITTPETLLHTLAKMAGIVEAIGDPASLPVRRTDVIKALNRALKWDLSAPTSTVRVLGTLRDFDRAQEVVDSIPDPGEQAMALAALAQSLIAAGELDRAASVVRSIPEPDAGRRKPALGVDWILTVQTEKQSIAKINALSDLARALFAHGRRELALAGVRHAENLVGAAAGLKLIRDAIPALAQALAAVGEQGKAEALLGAVADTDGKAEILLAIAMEASPAQARGLLAEAFVVGRWTRALAVLAEIDPDAVIAVADEFSELVAPALAGLAGNTE